MALIPARLRQAQQDHYAVAAHKVRRRMAAGARRDDLMSPMLDPATNPQMTKMDQGEIESTISMILVAGSETTATALAGMVCYLTQSPAELRKLAGEVRARFKHPDDMTLAALQTLPFLNAVISEGLRLCNPLAAGMLRRAPEGGATVCGYFLPEGVSGS